MTRAIQLDGAIEPEPYVEAQPAYDPDDPVMKAAFEEGRRQAREELLLAAPNVFTPFIPVQLQPNGSLQQATAIGTTGVTGTTLNTSGFMYPLTSGSGYWSSDGIDAMTGVMTTGGY